MVSIHASVRRRTDLSPLFEKFNFVSIHASVRRRTQLFLDGFLNFVTVSIHASVRRRTYFQEFSLLFWFRFQYTPPWGGERRKIKRFFRIHFVSIHASVRRRTSFLPCANNSDLSFNTRLREEANFYSLCIILHYSSFNTRLREEANEDQQITRTTEDVSIHASVRRRTNLFFLFFIWNNVSIHASVRRRTQPEPDNPNPTTGFNTRLREEANRKERK